MASNKLYKVNAAFSQIVNDMESDSDTISEFPSLQSALEEVTEDGHHDIVILPPPTDALSDEEEVDDDVLEDSSLPGDFAGPVALQVRHTVIENKTPTTSNPSQSDIPKRRKLAEPLPTWTDDLHYETSIPDMDVTDLGDSKPELDGKTPYEIFKLFFDAEIIDIITNETIRYARQKNNHSFEISKTEIERFIGILLFSGYHRLPRERLYWCRDEDINVSFVSDTLSRNRFDDIKRYLHFVNNDQLDKNDKLFKIRPLNTYVNKKLLQFGIFHKYLSIDEEMVPFFGRHTARMFMKGKPIRYGYKLWVLASDNGYPYQFDTYCGKNSNSADTEQFGLGHMLSLLDC